MSSQKKIRRDCTCPRARHQHGTVDGYLTDRCRCDDCREAFRIARSQHKKAVAYGRKERTASTDASPVREHLLLLVRRYRLTPEHLAKSTGVSKPSIRRILYGIPSRGVPPQETVRRSVADRILAYRPAAKDITEHLSDVDMISAVGTHRRLQALIALGYTMTQLSEYMGSDRSAVSDMLRRSQTVVWRARRVSRMYDELWNRLPPSSTQRERANVSLAKSLARKNGWFPPLAWDDDTIDDPEAKAVA